MTNTELVSCWNYFQLNYIPALRIARYVVKDNLYKIEENEKFYRQSVKQEIKDIVHKLDLLCTRTIDIEPEHIRWINIYCDNIDEMVEDNIFKLTNTIRMEFQKAMLDKDIEFFTALHLIDYALIIAKGTFNQCCKDLTEQKVIKSDPFEVVADSFSTYNSANLQSRWEEVCNNAMTLIPKKNSKGKPIQYIALNKPIHKIAIDSIIQKLANIDTIRDAMEKSYPYSHYYSAVLPYEESRDYAVTHGGYTKSGKRFYITDDDGDYHCVCCNKVISKDIWIKNNHKCEQCKPN